MRNAPKHLATAYDYEYVRENFDNWREYWQELYDSRMIWNNYDVEGDGITDATHRVIQSQDMEGNPITIQQVLEVDPNAKLFRIGFTAQEVEEVLNAN
jgi:hypothetical protein